MSTSTLASILILRPAGETAHHSPAKRRGVPGMVLCGAVRVGVRRCVRPAQAGGSGSIKRRSLLKNKETITTGTWYLYFNTPFA